MLHAGGRVAHLPAGLEDLQRRQAVLLADQDALQRHTALLSGMIRSFPWQQHAHHEKLVAGLHGFPIKQQVDSIADMVQNR